MLRPVALFITWRTKSASCHQWFVNLFCSTCFDSANHPRPCCTCFYVIWIDTANKLAMNLQSEPPKEKRVIKKWKA